MALYLSSNAATGRAVDQANDFTVHALRREKDGMLHYTNAKSTEDVVFDFHRTDGGEYEDFLGGGDYVATPAGAKTCLLYTSPSPRDRTRSRMPSSA